MSSGSGSLILTRLVDPSWPGTCHLRRRRHTPSSGEVSHVEECRASAKTEAPGGEPPTVALSGESDGAAQGGLAVLAAALHYAPALVRCAAAGGHPGPG